MKYNIILLTILISQQVNASEEYIFKLKTSSIINVQSNSNQVVYDQNGFDSNGIHKDTGTQYNQEGYDNTGYNQNGFNSNNIHKDTGTIYDNQGYDNSGRDSLGFDRSGLDSLGETKIVCPNFNGVYWYGTNTTNIPGNDYYAKLEIQNKQWEDKITTTIYWNNIIIATASGNTLKYSPFTKYYPVYSFIKDNYRYYFSTSQSSWTSGTTTQTINESYKVCREKIAI